MRARLVLCLSAAVAACSADNGDGVSFQTGAPNGASASAGDEDAEDGSSSDAANDDGDGDESGAGETGFTPGANEGGDDDDDAPDADDDDDAPGDDADPGDDGGTETGEPAECVSHGECNSGVCMNEACVTVGSCDAVLSVDGAASSGTYLLDPDGPGGTGAFQTYCDMDTDGGGWTLVMKLSSSTNVFRHSANYWTSPNVHNSADHTPNAAAPGTASKIASFNAVEGDELRLEWFGNTVGGHEFRYDGLAGRTALELFSGPKELVEGNENTQCDPSALTAAPGYAANMMGHGNGHQFYGVNGSDPASDGEETDSLRFGFGSNDEDDTAWSPQQGIGAGSHSLRWRSQEDCDNGCGCYGNDTEINTLAANLWVR